MQPINKKHLTAAQIIREVIKSSRKSRVVDHAITTPVFIAACFYKILKLHFYVKFINFIDKFVYVNFLAKFCIKNKQFLETYMKFYIEKQYQCTHNVTLRNSKKQSVNFVQISLKTNYTHNK